MCRGLTDVVNALERRLVGSVEQSDRLGRERLAPGDLAGVGGRLERVRERRAVGARGRGCKPCRDRRELEYFECVRIHATSVGAATCQELVALASLALRLTGLTTYARGSEGAASGGRDRLRPRD